MIIKNLRRRRKNKDNSRLLTEYKIYSLMLKIAIKNLMNYNLPEI